MNYKRKGHRGRNKANVMDNQACRVHGNSISKQAYYGNPKKVHVSASVRNKVDFERFL